jgi:hypothetical protein
MNQKTHPSETALDEFCREIVGVAQASEADIHAAAHAPFLYQRLRAQIAAEQTPLATIVPPRSSTWNFVAAFGAWQNRWRWMWATAAVGLVLLAGWRWLNPAPAAPAIAQQEMTSTVTPAQNKAMKKPEPLAPSAPEQLVPTVPAERQMVKATRKAPRFASRFAAETVAEETEIATEFMPLTYMENQDEEAGQIVRMEVPRAALIALGIPLAKELTSERITADVKVSDDGVALAIRLISNNNE